MIKIGDKYKGIISGEIITVDDVCVGKENTFIKYSYDNTVSGYVDDESEFLEDFDWVSSLLQPYEKLMVHVGTSGGVSIESNWSNWNYPDTFQPILISTHSTLTDINKPVSLNISSAKQLISHLERVVMHLEGL